MVIKIKEYLGKHHINIGYVSSNNALIKCPWKENHNHNDNKPSFSISLETGLYFCHGCGNKGNIVSLVKYLDNVNIKDALRIVYGGQKVVSSNLLLKKINDIRNGKDEETKIKFITKMIVPELIDYSKYGVKYLLNRGISKKSIRNFYIKFCAEGYFKNRVIIPVFDINDKPIFFEARSFKKHPQVKVLYPKGADKSSTLFNVNNVEFGNEVIVVEGIMDCIYVNQLGYNVVSSFGTHISNKQLKLLSKFKKVIICFDGDEAGHNAAYNISKELGSILNVRIMKLKKGKDPDEHSNLEFRIAYNKLYKLQDLQNSSRIKILMGKIRQCQ